MRERTYLATMAGLDVLLILAGGVMAWLYAVPQLPGAKSWSGATAVTAAISTVLIAMVGGYLLYEVNIFVFRIAESPGTQRNSRLAAIAFVAATVAGGVAGATLT